MQGRLPWEVPRDAGTSASVFSSMGYPASPRSFLAFGVGLTRSWTGVEGEGDHGAVPRNGASEPEVEGLDGKRFVCSERARV